MMPDLGPYWLEVTASWVVSLAILGALIAAVWSRSVKVKRQLAEMEGRRRAAAAPGSAAGETRNA